MQAQCGKVAIPINIPVDIALASLDGVTVQSAYGPTGQQVKFSTVDGRSLYLYPDIADRVKALNARPGETIRLCKRQKPGGQRGVDWQVEKVGEQRDGTFVVPKDQKADPANSPELVKPASSTVAIDVSKSISQPGAQRKSLLRSHAAALIDVQADLIRYAAEKHQGTVKPDDVRAIVLTVYIQQSKNNQGVRR